ncbi:MAG: hypothetical protein M3176_04795 [Chloroflexota bacterium]|nr:hypothetical protein [Chloroflexota bacterium]MDQ6906129.1 hypothetical protein [Chloroflexota bacterium]
MDNQIRLIQFIHPGGEHVPDDGDHKHWNTGIHQRKFLQHHGQYVSGNALDYLVTDDLHFWGEWEPESTVVGVIRNRVDGGPHYVYKPWYGAIPTTWSQNTDPFVFGDSFLYSNCKQSTKLGLTQLAMLGRGSVILFGSCMALSQFVVDTVFVVDQWIKFYPPNYKGELAGHVSKTFEDVTLSRIKEHTRSPLTLYFGATYDHRVAGMFSFFPCLPNGHDKCGFARPVIEMQGQITNNLTQGKKMTVQPDLASMQACWYEVVRQVTDKKLMLGVSADLPEQRIESDTSLGTKESHPSSRRGC